MLGGRDYELIVRCWISILLVMCFAALGSGAVGQWHDLEHAREDAAIAALAREASLPEPAPVQHDESNCSMHARLQSPMVSIAWVSLLVCLGLLVAFLTEIAPAPVSHRFTLQLTCRGPPVC